MSNSDHASVIERYEKAGIRIGGYSDTTADLIVLDPAAYAALDGGELALGESYVRGWWREANRTTLWLIHLKRIKDGLYERPHVLSASRQSLDLAAANVVLPYNIGIAGYRAKLAGDPYLQYSCGYYGRGAQTDPEAQIHKLAITGERLGLRAGMHVLDIGGGCGGLACFLAETQGVTVDMLTLSQDQAQIAERMVWMRGLKGRVQVFLRHYADHEGSYDRIVSIGALEHFGRAHYRSFFEKCDSLLASDGCMVIHFIWGRNPLGRLAGATSATNAWIDGHYFPGGDIPAKSLVAEAAKDFFVLLDTHDFGIPRAAMHPYARTNLAWDANLARNRGRIEGTRMPDGRPYDETFFRTEHYASHLFAGQFSSGAITVGQLHFARRAQAGYQAIR